MEFECITDKTAENAREGMKALDFIINTYGILGEPIKADELEQLDTLKNAKELLRSMIPELQ